MNFLLGSNNTKSQKELQKELEAQGLELNQQRREFEEKIHTQNQKILTGKALLDKEVLISRDRSDKLRTQMLLEVKKVQNMVEVNGKKSVEGGKVLKDLKKKQETDMSDVNRRLNVVEDETKKIDAKITTLAGKIPDIVSEIDEKAKAHVDLTKKIENVATTSKEKFDVIAALLKEIKEKQSKMESVMKLSMKYSSKALDQIENEKMMRRLGEPKQKKRRTSKKVGEGCCPKCKKSSGVCSKRGQPGHLPLLHVDESDESSSSSESD